MVATSVAAIPLTAATGDTRSQFADVCDIMSSPSIGELEGSEWLVLVLAACGCCLDSCSLKLYPLKNPGDGRLKMPSREVKINLVQRVGSNWFMIGETTTDVPHRRRTGGKYEIKFLLLKIGVGQSSGVHVSTQPSKGEMVTISQPLRTRWVDLKTATGYTQDGFPETCHSARKSGAG